LNAYPPITRIFEFLRYLLRTASNVGSRGCARNHPLSVECICTARPATQEARPSALDGTKGFRNAADQVSHYVANALAATVCLRTLVLGQLDELRTRISTVAILAKKGSRPKRMAWWALWSFDQKLIDTRLRAAQHCFRRLNRAQPNLGKY
jgi:hypothetical protein